jgi:4-hydroxy-tetrahydrodipicolinate reductase
MKIALLGYGKMGKAIEKIAISRNHQIPYRIGQDNAHLLSTLTPNTVDVAIEFSHPACAYHHIHTCLQKGIPTVAGTTGWLEQKESLEQYCQAQQGTFFYAPNFSLAAYVFFKLNALLAKYMAPYPDYAVHITETHHTTKQDKPSGTALQIAQDILERQPALQGWSLAECPIPHTIPITVHRLPEQVGTHAVAYSSPIESLSLQHTAWDRASFAQGVVQVAEWIPDKKGILTMDDFFEIQKT